jgi:hypothetical protein
MACADSSICKVSPQGEVSMIADDVPHARGVAIDAGEKHLLIVERGGHSGAGYVLLRKLY